MADLRTSSEALVEGLKGRLRDLLRIPSPSRSLVDRWASAYDPSYLAVMKRWIADSSSGFVDFMIDLTPGGREATDAETRRIIALAEAEGARLIGAEPCPADHGGATVLLGRPCPVCGAVA